MFGMKRRKISILVGFLLVATLVLGASPLYAQAQTGNGAQSQSGMKRITNADREAAAARAKKAGLQLATDASGLVMPTPLATPDYFGSFPNYANSPLPKLVPAPTPPPTPPTPTSPTTFYFAEGTTRPGYDPYLCIQNTGSKDASVKITYMKGDGSTETQSLTVGKNSRSTVTVKDKLGVGDDPAHDFSAIVQCTNGQKIVAERPMYFNYKPGELNWNGGHDVVGAVAPSAIFYFAEGTTRPGYDPYLCIQNPGTKDASVKITYMKGDGSTETQSLTVGKNSRSTVTVKNKLGVGDDPAHDFSAQVECTNGQKIVAERPMYFNYKPGELNWNGGHDVVGFTFATNVKKAKPKAPSSSKYVVVPGTGVRKFVDSLPGLGAANANDLGQYIPVAIPDKTKYNGADYYEIELGQYTEKLHKDLPATTLRGYRQTNTTDSTVSKFSYLGPLIVSQKDRPVRVKFTNSLPTGDGGNLFIPVDTTIMGAGMGPLGMNVTNGYPMNYTQNRASVHLHGGNTPWISDGTMHQWITPAGETTDYPKGVSVQNVPDMPDPGPGSQTFYYTNQQSARLMFYHDHAYGITRLNVYAGEAAPYIVQDSAEKGMVNSKAIPSDQVPLVIQDKTFVPDDAQLAAEDPTWDKTQYGGKGNLWLPHVYMPNQNPYDVSGANAMGRWDYGPWFWPPFTGLVNGPVDNPYYNVNAPWEPPKIPGTPNPSIVPEAFMDTPVVNGTAYPYVQVGRKTYRFRILNASNDRSLNLQLYYAKSDGTMWDAKTGALKNGDAGEVSMVRADPGSGLPDTWPTDGREGGVPDPKSVGPKIVQIGNEGGFLPQVAELPNTPVGYEYDRRSITVLNVSNKTLLLGPAERADVIVDFSKVPYGSKLILYNDSPAPVPAFDSRYDYYTGCPDRTATGGAPSTVAGYGPNTRTIMQFQVSSKGKGGMSGFSLKKLKEALPTAYAKFQAKPIVPQAEYNAAFKANYPTDAYARIADTSMNFFNGPLTGLKVTNGGSGYSTAPNVGISGGGGTGAAATAQISGVTAITLNSGGSGYTTTPDINFTGGGGGSGATATAQILGITAVNVTTRGGGYSIPPDVSFTDTGGTGTGATATAQISGVTAVTVPSGGGGSGYVTAPTVNFSGGGGTGAAGTATISGGVVTGVTITDSGHGYVSAPMVNFSGGSPSTPASATATVAPGSVTWVTVTNSGSNYTGPVTVTFTGGGGAGAGAVASATVGTGTDSVTGIILTNGGSGYTSNPTVNWSGGGGSLADATTTITSGAVTGLILTNPGSGYTATTTVGFSGGGGSGAAAVANGVAMTMQPKAIQELFDPDYGRMNATLGVELPNTTGINQTTIPYVDIDPPTEIIKNSDSAAPIGTLADGTQIWKITHNGVDTHAIHWHMFNVQLVNRIGWDGMIKPPDPNEVGWKETVRMNPLEDAIVALRPIIPKNLPFDLPNSNRPLDVTMPTTPVGSTVGFSNIDPSGQPAPVTNHVINFGWEYVWHCHLLGHEENIMMRPMAIAVAPIKPTTLSATRFSPTEVRLTWKDESLNEKSWTIQRATNLAGPWTTLATVATTTEGTAGATVPSPPYSDTTVSSGTQYWYRVIATNVVGDTTTYTPPATGYPNVSVDSTPSDTATVTP